MSKIIIVGGVAGGATAAARLRRLREEDEIIIFERDEYISFANCGLPYYIGGVITEREQLLVQTVEGMSRRYRLDIRNFSEVVSIQRDGKTVTVYDKKKGTTYEESYDKLILATGSNPLKPRFEEGEEPENFFTLRNIPDTDAIKNYIIEKNPRKAVVIGGGFIGLELAENLVHKGIQVTLVEMGSQVMRQLDFEMAQIAHEEMNRNGIHILLNDSISHFENEGRTAVLRSGESLETDMAVAGIGVVPENALRVSGGLAVGDRGHFLTNPSLQALDGKTGEAIPDIYIIGDAIEVTDRVSGAPVSVPLAWPANRQGRLVADHINGRDVAYAGTLGSSVLKLFDLTLAATGNTSASLEARGIPFKSICAHRANHASYYPGSSMITMKILYSPGDGKILGAQAVGREGTEKRIDVIATAMSLGAKVTDLASLELCYAPPYSSAKDPVNVLGYIAENLEAGFYDMVQVWEIDEKIAAGGFLLDVRTPVEFSAGRIQGAVNIPVDDLRERLGEITAGKDDPIYVTCQVGLRAHVAIMILKGEGYTNLYNLNGGHLNYRHYTYRMVKPAGFGEPGFLDIDQQIKPPAEEAREAREVNTIRVNASGLQCPGPLMATYKAVTEASEGDIIEVTATDYGFTQDVVSWCEANGHTLKSVDQAGGAYVARIQKGCREAAAGVGDQRNATMVVFSGELDKVLAAMIIAQGAVAGGKNVTLFFTFWGLNALRKRQSVKVRKNLIERMFGWMMPRGARKLPLSNMNMLGVGPAMIKGIMKQHHVDDLEVMIRRSMELGVRFIACTMSMDLMGIRREELLDGVEFAGVGSYISSNENVGTTLFI